MKRLPEFLCARKSLYALIIASFFMMMWIWTYSYAAQQHPCSDDIAKYCKGLQPGKGSIIGCLQENENKLSDECRVRLEKSRKRLEAAKKACGADVEKFCKGIKPGGGRIARCLAQHADELSPGCCAKCDLAREKIEREKK
jgi:hypothetical protein